MSIVNNRLLVIFSILVVLLNYLFLIVNSGMYWDDWVLYFEDLNHMVHLFEQTGGNGFVGYLHYFMIHGLGIWAYKVLTVILIIISGISLFKILENIDKLSKIDRVVISIFFIVYPLFHTKALLINFPYTLMTTLFFVSFYFITKYIDNKRNYIYYFISLAFLYVSFFVQSILVFCFIIVIYIFYIEKITRSETIVYILKKYILFFITPFIFFIIKKSFFKPYGLYSGYNEININNVVHKLTLSFNKSYTDFWIYESFYFIVPVIFVISIIYLLKYNKQLPFFFQNTYKYIILLVLGIFMFILATFPYISVNKIPQILSMNDRLQVLYALPFALITYSLISILVFYQKRIVAFSFILVLIIFIYFNNKQYINLLKDSIYQDAFMFNLKTNNEIYQNTLFVMKDGSIEQNMHKRRKGAYEYAGQLRKVFGDDKRFIIENYFFLANNKSLDYVKDTFENKKYAHYNYSNAKFGKPTHFINLQVTKFLTWKDVVYLSLLKYNNQTMYTDLVSKLIKLNVERIKE